MQEGAGPRPYDVSVSYLIELDPLGWLDWLELPADGPVESIESDLGTVLAEVDKVLRIAGPTPWLAHIELQANRDPLLPSRLLQYHALLYHRHQVRVETTVVLLRPEADGPELLGRLELPARPDGPSITFRYRVIRLWERPVAELLGGGLGVVPLAPLATIEPADLHDVVRQLDDRLGSELPDTRAEEYRTAVLLLLRLRYTRLQIIELVEEMVRLRESPAYDIIVEVGLEQGRRQGLQEGRQEGLQEGRQEGRQEGLLTRAREDLLKLGTAKLGPPDTAVVDTINGIDELNTLDALLLGVLTASTWGELLANRLET